MWSTILGSWSAKAAKEAAKYGTVNLVYPKPSKFTQIEDQKNWKLDPNAAYVYYCDNETVDGVEFQFVPETNGVPIVCDMSSNMLSRPIDISKVRKSLIDWKISFRITFDYNFQFGVIYAGAQKNIGPSGITLVIVREDLIGYAMPITPSVFDFAIIAKENSVYNTPPTFM